jgi:protein O-GlcNAc transferase
MASAQSRKALQRAGALHEKGDLAGAESLYQSILRRDAAAVDALHGLALVYARQGRLEEARRHLDRALGLEPARPELHFHRAEIAAALGLPDHALESYGEALALRPDYFEVLVNMADVLLQLRRPDEALARLDRAVSLRPGDVAALNNRGNALQALKRHEEALECFARVLQELPGHADVLNNRASALLSLGRYTEAAQACRDALAQRADHVSALLNLGRTQAAQGQPEEALRSYDAALAMQPGHVDGWREHAALLAGLRRDREAGESLRKLLAMDGDSWSDWTSLAAIELRLGRPQEALEACDRALQRQRDDAAPWAMRATALQALGRDAQAASAYQNALWLDGNTPYVEGRLASLRLAACDWGPLAAATGRILRGVRAGEPLAEPDCLLHLTESAEDQLACARNYARAEQPRPSLPQWRGERYRHDRIRVAYLLGDLREDSRSCDLAALLEGHARARFELYGFARACGTPGPAAARVSAALEHFVELRDATDLDVARLLRQHEIDIAVEMRGAVEAGRSAVFALRPCPVQVTGWGFPGTLGSDCRDYLFADAHVMPSGREHCFIEKPVRFPEAFLACNPARGAPQQAPSRAELGLPEDRAPVFGALHDPVRITPEMFGAWLDILNEVEAGVLWLADGQGSMPGNLRRLAQARGIDPSRLVFAPASGHSDHLARIRHADLALDTLPFNDSAATSDMLWAGVPVITCSGDAFAARMSGSLLRAVGMPEFATASLEEYKALAVRLGREPARLDEAKRKLAATRLTQPLFDPGRYCRHVELAYEVMYRRYQDDAPAAALSVDALDAVRP